MNELTASTIAMLTGESPVRNEEERRCQWVSDAGEQCCTILNPYNSREYCLCAASTIACSTTATPSR